MPTWSVFVIIVVIVIAYYASTSYAKERRRDRVGDWFAKIPDFHANQVFVDARGESAVGIDDRGRRLAVARRRQEPRSRVYSFAQVIAVVLEQNGAVIERLPRRGAAAPEAAAAAHDITSLFGSTAPEGRTTSERTPVPGSLSSLAARISLDDPAAPELLLRFHAGRAVDQGSVAADKAVGQARVFMNAFDLLLKRAALARSDSTID